MNGSRHDHDLEASLASLREDDGRRTPPYARVRDAALAGEAGRTRRVRAAWTVAAAAVLGAVAVTVTLLDGRNGASVGLEPEIALASEMSAWSAPTDVLYELASLEIPDSVPGLDVGSGYVPDALSSDSRLAAPDSSGRNDSEVER